MILDSGNREQYFTGAVRDNEKKGRYDLLSPIFIRSLAIHLENSLVKYEPNNWQKGIPLSRIIQSILRHSFQLLEGDESEDHAAAAACNLMFFIHLRQMINDDLLPKSLDDLPKYAKKETDNYDYENMPKIDKYYTATFEVIPCDNTLS